jgi:hypothetical protein
VPLVDVEGRPARERALLLGAEGVEEDHPGVEPLGDLGGDRQYARPDRRGVERDETVRITGAPPVVLLGPEHGSSGDGASAHGAPRRGRERLRYCGVSM